MNKKILLRIIMTILIILFAVLERKNIVDDTAYAILSIALVVSFFTIDKKLS